MKPPAIQDIWIILAGGQVMMIMLAMAMRSSFSSLCLCKVFPSIARFRAWRAAAVKPAWEPSAAMAMPRWNLQKDDWKIIFRHRKWHEYHKLGFLKIFWAKFRCVYLMESLASFRVHCICDFHRYAIACRECAVMLSLTKLAGTTVRAWGASSHTHKARHPHQKYHWKYPQDPNYALKSSTMCLHGTSVYHVYL